MKKLVKSREITSVIIIIVLFLGVGLFNSSFLTSNNIFQTVNGSVVYSVVALGMAFVLFIGEIDVSVGATLGFSAALAGEMVIKGVPLIAVFLVVILFGAVVGLMNAIGVLYFKIPSIIMTLGTNGIVRGLIYVYTGGKWIENLPLGFKGLSQKNLFGTLSLFFVVLLVIVSALYIFTKRNTFGKTFLAIGDNEGGARLVGLPVTKAKIASFIICAVFASVAGVLYASRVGFITPTAGIGYEMTAIAACVIGGINLNGGMGSVYGAITGSILMASISRILVFIGLPSTFDNTITGLVLIVIVVVGAVIQKREIEMNRRNRLAAKVKLD